LDADHPANGSFFHAETHNTLYVGRLSWDRCGYVKDPRTGKRVAKPRDPQNWETTEVPELRIVDQQLWDAVKARQREVRLEIGRNESGNALNRAHRREFLLSGLLTCGCCGGGYTIMAKDRYGCATRRIKGTCDNSKTISRDRVEQRVLGGLRDRLLAPELVAEFVRAFAEEMAELSRQTVGIRIQLETQLADVERRLEGVLRAIENGPWSNALHERLSVSDAPAPFDRCGHSGLRLRRPVPGHQFIDAFLRPAVHQTSQQVAEMDLRIDAIRLAGLDQRRQTGPGFSSFVAAREQAVLS
jgi:hypothetical protein